MDFCTDAAKIMSEVCPYCDIIALRPGQSLVCEDAPGGNVSIRRRRKQKRACCVFFFFSFWRSARSRLLPAAAERNCRQIEPLRKKCVYKVSKALKYSDVVYYAGGLTDGWGRHLQPSSSLILVWRRQQIRKTQTKCVPFLKKNKNKKNKIPQQDGLNDKQTLEKKNKTKITTQFFYHVF